MFREGFVWGAGSSSYQIEGAATQDGRLDSIWDALCRRQGAIHNAETGAIACDHYNRYREDVGLMKRMGLKAYRFSVAWPRVMPTGVGPVNEKGLAFYDRLVDTLLASGIEPWITLYHWDMPQMLFERGGLLNRDFAQWFADYSAAVVDRLSDRVTHWITINEPQVFISLGYGDAKHAPAIRLSFPEQLLAAHNCLLMHGRAAQIIRTRAKKKPIIGWAPVGRVDYPIDETPENIDAARTASFSFNGKHFWSNNWFGDPAILGHYPEEGLRHFASDMPKFDPRDMDIIKQPLDFYGLNIYQGTQIKRGANGQPENVPFPPGHALTTMRWPVAPKSLYWGPRFHHERYKLPIVITENGMAGTDWVQSDGRVHDAHRIDFTRQYLLELARASADGVPVHGYFHWSVMDNFEWAEGYKERFGLIHVDYLTQKRTLKDSAHWYAEVIRTNGDHLSDTAPYLTLDAPKENAVVIPNRETTREHASAASNGNGHAKRFVESKVAPRKGTAL
jgi:beta-glucosidase